MSASGAELPMPHPASTRAAFVRLAVVVVAAVVVAAVLHALAVLLVVVALVAMIMLHELGHFATAKWSGMKVTEYFLGFGPRLWSVRRGETEYGVKAIPAGGYVRIVGMTQLETVDPVDEPRSYRQATFPRRLLVGVAGSAMHFIIAYLLLYAMLVGTGFPTYVASNEVSALSVLQGTASPAIAAGIKTGDEIVGVNGHRASITDVVSVIEAHAGATVALMVERDNTVRTVDVVPIDGRRVAVPGADGSHPAKTGSHPVGFIGVDLGGPVDQRSNPFTSVGRAVTLFGSVTASTFKGIASVFSLHGLGSFAHQVATANQKTPTTTASSNAGNSGQLISILGAIQLGAAAARQDVAELLYILVAINVFVGVINLFPMLPLDGGHVSIAIYERVRSRRGRRYVADVTKLMPLAYAFVVFMVIIGLGALYVNALHPVTLPGG